MLTVTLYTRDGCSLCQEAENELMDLQEVYPHRLIKIDIEKENLPEFENQIPVLEIGPYQVKAPFDVKTLRMTLGAAQDRIQQLEIINLESHQKKVKRGKRISFGDKLFYYLSNRYMMVFNLFVFMYLGFAVLAPVLQANSIAGPAKIIYVIYGRLCHQLSFRSWFIYGEQYAYPREIARVNNLMTYEDATGNNPFDLQTAYEFTGNEILGYKLALCQRDIAIYGGILIFGLIFSLTGRKIPSLTLWGWFILGIIPIGLDGASQILSQLPWDIIPLRESTPLLRTITGGLFGFTTAWFGYPVIEESMADTRKVMTVKFAASQTKASEE